MLDQALTALVEDLHNRGMEKDVSVVCWGEFGRTPQVNKNAGRDHWPKLSTAVLACGQMNHGQVIGASDEFGYKAEEQRVSPHDLHATMLHLLGIDHKQLTYRYNGRDMRLTDVAGTLIPQIVA